MGIDPLFTRAIGIFDGNLRFADPSQSRHSLRLGQGNATSCSRPGGDREMLIKQAKQLVTPGKIGIAQMGNGPEWRGGSGERSAPRLWLLPAQGVWAVNALSLNPNSSSLLPKRAVSFKRKYGPGTFAPAFPAFHSGNVAPTRSASSRCDQCRCIRSVRKGEVFLRLFGDCIADILFLSSFIKER